MNDVGYLGHLGKALVASYVALSVFEKWPIFSSCRKLKHCLWQQHPQRERKMCRLFVSCKRCNLVTLLVDVCAALWFWTNNDLGLNGALDFWLFQPSLLFSNLWNFCLLPTFTNHINRLGFKSLRVFLCKLVPLPNSETAYYSFPDTKQERKWRLFTLFSLWFSYLCLSKSSTSLHIFLPSNSRCMSTS